MSITQGSVAALLGAFALGALGACTPVVPPELAGARNAYAEASQGPAAQHAPAELHKAREALDAAERAFSDRPKDQRTLDLAYVAERRAELAEAMGLTEQARQARLVSEQQLAQLQTRQLAVARNQAADAERRAMESEQRAKEAQERLAKLAPVSEENRGTVVTLPGNTLFASNQATLLPDAERRLDQLVAALLQTKERKLTIEAYADARGSDERNLDLSQRRAEAVRDYIVSRGYDADLVVARGLGKATGAVDRASAQGRASGRRVEIVIGPKKED